ncbi:MAG: hypothetical protein JRJ77_06645 [Deltaproteobacteria bacterium]|nr:hypothetical protein [Deltaproteobacteria bacterium]
MEKMFYTVDEVSKITRLPQSLIRYYVRVKKVTISPEHYPDVNPRLVKGKLLFAQKDIEALLRFIDKKQDESWEKWQLRRIQEIKAKRQLAEDRQEKRPNLRIVKGKKKGPAHS